MRKSVRFLGGLGLAGTQMKMFFPLWVLKLESITTGNTFIMFFRGEKANGSAVSHFGRNAWRSAPVGMRLISQYSGADRHGLCPSTVRMVSFMSFTVLGKCCFVFVVFFCFFWGGPVLF